MNNHIEQKALELRQEHRELSNKKKDAQKNWSNRVNNPRLFNQLVALAVSTVSEDPYKAYVATAGPRATKNVKSALVAYDANIEASREHYRENPNEYHDMAIQDAKADGVDIDFGGQVATSIEQSNSKPRVPTTNHLSSTR